MAWTTPRIWTDGELVTAAIMNAHVKANLDAAAPHLIVRKTADESVTSSSVLQNDNDLVLTVAANEIWDFRLQILMTGGGTGDFKLAFTFPTGGTLSATGWGLDTASAVSVQQTSNNTSPSTSMTFAPVSTTIACLIPVHGVFVNSSTAGSLQLQWAQNASDGTATIVKANSTLWAAKLA